MIITDVCVEEQVIHIILTQDSSEPCWGCTDQHFNWLAKIKMSAILQSNIWKNKICAARCALSMCSRLPNKQQNSSQHALVIVMTGTTQESLFAGCSFGLDWTGLYCWGKKDYHTASPSSPVSLSPYLLTCITYLQNTISISHSPHPKAPCGCGADSHFQRATDSLVEYPQAANMLMLLVFSL